MAINGVIAALKQRKKRKIKLTELKLVNLFIGATVV